MVGQRLSLRRRRSLVITSPLNGPQLSVAGPTVRIAKEIEKKNWREWNLIGASDVKTCGVWLEANLVVVMQFSTQPATTESRTRSGSWAPVSCCLNTSICLLLLHYEMDLLPEELHNTTNRHQRKQSPVLFSHPRWSQSSPDPRTSKSEVVNQLQRKTHAPPTWPGLGCASDSVLKITGVQTTSAHWALLSCTNSLSAFQICNVGFQMSNWTFYMTSRGGPLGQVSALHRRLGRK